MKSAYLVSQGYTNFCKMVWMVIIHLPRLVYTHFIQDAVLSGFGTRLVLVQYLYPGHLKYFLCYTHTCMSVSGACPKASKSGLILVAHRLKAVACMEHRNDSILCLTETYLCGANKAVHSPSMSHYRPQSRGDNMFGSVHLSVRLFVLFCLNRLTYDLDWKLGSRASRVKVNSKVTLLK